MLEFETSSGNSYAWDDHVGLFIPVSNTMKAVINEISNQKNLTKNQIANILNGLFDKDDISFCYDWYNKWQKISPNVHKSQSELVCDSTYIKSYILRHGLLALTLGVTEDCNFRCKYCTFSDSYDFTRTHSNKYMNFDTARKAIDHFFSLLSQGKKFHPLRRPSIGFYGGEPLLNFELIKNCVEYISKNYHDFGVSYGLTTNCSLMDEEKANWLMEHDFSIAVSLDGPEKEHNRLRVYRNEDGTFRDVMKNVGPIMKTGYDKINSTPVFDWKSDLFKMDEFFKGKEIPIIARVSMVNNGEEGCSYYDQFSEEDHQAYLDQVKRAKRYYYSCLDERRKSGRESFFDKMIGQNSSQELFGCESISQPHPIMPFTGSCVPGRKLFVDVNGTFHMCEKINDAFPIGNVEEGLDFKKIEHVVNKFISHMDNCPSCSVSRKCNYCFVTFMTDKGFLKSSRVCDKVDSRSKWSFTETLEVAELDSEFVENCNSKLKDIKKHFGD